MGSTITEFKQIFSDLKNSWYFRVWVFFWLFFVIMSFVALVKLGHHSERSMKHPDGKIWYENATSMRFPRFHFRSGGEQDVILSVTCHTPNGTAFVPTGACESFHGNPPSLSQCVSVMAHQIEVLNQRSNWFELAISCNITTNADRNTSHGSMIGFNVEGHDIFEVGEASFTDNWIAPNNLTQLILQKERITVDKHEKNFWNRQVVYHTTAWVPGFYHVRVMIGGFGVFNFSTAVLYNGWQALGDIGGFAFLLACFHTLVMIIVGFCMVNNSEFILKSSGGSGERSVQNGSGEKATYSLLKDKDQTY